MATTAESKEGITSAKTLWMLLTPVAVILGLWLLVFEDSTPAQGNIPEIPTHLAEEGPLWVTVVESGTIRARDQIVLKSEVQGQTQVLWLVPEGQQVEKGDLLVRLDSSSWENRKADREIWMQRTEAGQVWGRENLKVTNSRTESEIETAALAIEFAREDLTKYIEGDFPNQQKEAQRAVTLAEASRATASDDLNGKEALFKKDFVTQIELDTARRLLQRADLQVELAQGRFDLLKTHTYKRNVNRLESDLAEAKRHLERTRLASAADIVQAKASLAKTQHWFEFGEKFLDRILTQIANSEIYAPAAGTVVYATRSPKGGGHRRMGLQPLEEGQMVHERQELIHLRTNNAVMAQVDIRESDIGKVKIGQRVRITVDALPGKEFTGQVTTIALLPDAQSSWMGSGPNVYGTDIFIAGDSGALRTGMSCRAEIVVEHYENVVSVPVEAVLRVNGTPTVYVAKGRKIEERQVEIGMASANMVRISANLVAGERVLLAPPLEQATVTYSEIIEGARDEARDDAGDEAGTANR